MKRIILVVAVLTLVLALVGCGAGNVGGDVSSTGDTSSAETESKLTEEEAEDSLDGLIAYLVSNGLMEKTNEKKMEAGFIGAKAGMRYSYRVGNSDVAIELYEYDLNALDDTARDYIAQVEKDGKLTILDREVTGAVMSDSGKYLMVYTDGSTEEENVKRTEDLKAAFQAFKN